MRITEGVKRQNVADLLMYVNARLWIGHFDLWHEDGAIVFRHAMIFPGAESQPRPNARRCSIWLWKPVSIITRPSSSSSGAAKAPKDAVDAAVNWSARGERDPRAEGAW